MWPLEKISIRHVNKWHKDENIYLYVNYSFFVMFTYFETYYTYYYLKSIETHGTSK